MPHRLVDPTQPLSAAPIVPALRKFYVHVSTLKTQRFIANEDPAFPLPWTGPRHVRYIRHEIKDFKSDKLPLCQKIGWRSKLIRELEGSTVQLAIERRRHHTLPMSCLSIRLQLSWGQYAGSTRHAAITSIRCYNGIVRVGAIQFQAPPASMWVDAAENKTHMAQLKLLRDRHPQLLNLTQVTTNRLPELTWLDDLYTWMVSEYPRRR